MNGVISPQCIDTTNIPGDTKSEWEGSPYPPFPYPEHKGDTEQLKGTREAPQANNTDGQGEIKKVQERASYPVARCLDNRHCNCGAVAPPTYRYSLIDRIINRVMGYVRRFI